MTDRLIKATFALKFQFIFTQYLVLQGFQISETEVKWKRSLKKVIVIDS